MIKVKSFASLVLDQQIKPKGKTMNTVRYKREDLAPLTQEREAELKALSQISDDAIDYSDIPKLSADFWQNAVRGKFYRPVKTQTSVRIDADVIDWLKGQGKGYQTRMNAILRDAMMRDLKHHR